MILGDLGADVVKLERRGSGDNARSDKPQFAPNESYYFLVFNRNKRSLTVDFRSESGQKLVRDLASTADVLVENFRAGTMDKMGCGWERLSKLNPRLIMTRVTGFGPTGPYSDQIATDTVAQAMGGLMHLTGQADGPPLVCGTYVVDYVTALYATIATVAALQHRATTGLGQLVDVTLLGSAISLLLTAIIEYGTTGEELTRIGNDDRFAAPSDAFRTADDKWVYIVVGTSHFSRLASAIGQPNLIQDERFATGEARLTHRREVNAIVQGWVSERTQEDVVSTMRSADVLCSAIAGVKDVFENPQIRHRGQIVDVPHPILGSFQMQGVSMALGSSPATIRRPPPLLGQHTSDVLRDWLSYEDDQIDALRDLAVV
jgi:crotonobetainyl-CoA:carnitine CoA-transferase CaiB-like acyl-CoA transferase